MVAASSGSGPASISVSAKRKREDDKSAQQRVPVRVRVRVRVVVAVPLLTTLRRLHAAAGPEPQQRGEETAGPGPPPPAPSPPLSPPGGTASAARGPPGFGAERRAGGCRCRFPAAGPAPGSRPRPGPGRGPGAARPGPAMPAAMSPAAPAAQEALEAAGRIIDRQIQDDRCYPDLSELLAVPAPGEGPRGGGGASPGLSPRSAPCCGAAGRPAWGAAKGCPEMLPLFGSAAPRVVGLALPKHAFCAPCGCPGGCGEGDFPCMPRHTGETGLQSPVEEMG